MIGGAEGGAGGGRGVRGGDGGAGRRGHPTRVGPGSPMKARAWPRPPSLHRAALQPSAARGAPGALARRWGALRGPTITAWGLAAPAREGQGAQLGPHPLAAAAGALPASPFAQLPWLERRRTRARCAWRSWTSPTGRCASAAAAVSVGGGGGGAGPRGACARPPLRHGLPPRGLAAPTPLALVALTPCLPGLHPAPADQICLWCYHHILEEAAKESLPARCPNCRTDYDQEKITMQQIDAQQCVHRGRAWGARRRSCAHVLAGRAHPAG